MNDQRDHPIILWISACALMMQSVLLSSEEHPHREIQYLSGKDNMHTVTWDFYCTGGRKSGFWTEIEVPSHWEQQGFGRYNYGRDYHTYGKKFKYSDEQGLYRYVFMVPESWKNRIVNIVFEGSMTDTEVRINGQLAGEIHQGAFYRFQYNISDLLRYGTKNRLQVTVSKVSANPSVNHAERRADYWIFGGIFRPVYLESFPCEHIERVAISAGADGFFSMDVLPKNLKGERTLYAQIIDVSGAVVADCQAHASPEDSLITLKTEVKNPLLWTPETPVLYHVHVFLKEKGQVQYHTIEKFGFRTIEIRKADGIYVNGIRVKMKGINRHVLWPETGRCISPEIDRTDVQLIKAMNMNAVRCSHYPPDKSFLDCCDSLGLFVVDELAGWHQAYDTSVGEKLVKEMVTRDVNHPSVIFWSNGNEGGTNKALDDDFYQYDPSKRPVIHCHHRRGKGYNGIDTNHYENYAGSKKLLKGPMIYMPTEFLHGQNDGGMGAALYDYWEMFWNSDLSGGGFLWAFVDEGIVRTDFSGVVDVNRVNAPDGVLGPHREKEGSFYAIQEIFSPVIVRFEPLSGDETVQLFLENRYHFTSLNQCTFQWQLINFRRPADCNAGYRIMNKGTASGPDVPPSATGKLVLDLPSDWKHYDALRVEVRDPFYHSVISQTLKIKNQRSMVNELVNIEKGEVEVTEEEGRISLKANGIRVTFNHKDGTLSNLRNDYSEPLSFSNGPVLVSGKADFVKMTVFRENDGVVVESRYQDDLKYARWKMYGSGWLRLEYEYQVEGEQPFLGISFDYPESNIIGVKWLGNGPYRVWKNRIHGGELTVHQSMYNDTQTGSSPWIYPEFKGYFSDIIWIEFNTVEGQFLVVANEKNLFVRLFEFYSLPGPVNHPVLPVGDISFLDGIPPTGTKMGYKIHPDASDLGPHSQMNCIEGPIRRTLWFYFGLPE
ncbi:glycoside hydrolase family 2 [bacterium]|nr:glycoside hydrolase family 2 [bacterium]